MKAYNKVPKIITGKDLDYLQDMFNWNFLAYKNTLDAACSVDDNKIKRHLLEISDVFYNELVNILNVLERGLYENSK